MTLKLGRRHRGLAALLVAMAVAGPALAQERGRIRICHDKGLDGISANKFVPIPKGTGFVNAFTKDGDDYLASFIGHTTEDVVLPPKPGCVTVGLILDENFDHFHLTKKYPPLRSQLAVPGLDVHGTVLDDFQDMGAPP